MRRTALLAAALAGTTALAPATAAPRRPARDATNRALLDEVRALRAEVEQLRAKVDAQGSQQATTQAQVEATRTQVQQVQQVQTQVASAPPVTPAEVDTKIATAVDKEHHNSVFYYKGITITPGGFLELAGIYRQHFQGNDIASSFSIPFPNNRASHVAEGRFTARQSRLSFLAEGNVNPAVHLAMYGEFDFQGGAQTANSNQSNSYNPRIRNLYGTIDWNRGSYGIHLLAGQNWSLLTTNGKGITPRNEAIPPVIDAQYVPGFFWARQPGVRLTGDFLDHRLWLAVAAENEATTFVGGTIPSNVTVNQQAGTGFDSANTLSLNHVPDFIGKAAYEADIGKHHVHIEGFGVYRTFSEHFNGAGNGSVHGYGYGGNLTVQVVPGLLDAQVTGITGRGIARYGSSGLQDVTFDGSGQIHVVHEYMLLAGATLHPTKQLDVYAFGGEEREFAQRYGTFGVGLTTADNRGCFVEGGACAGNTNRIRQLTVGAWDRFYQGSFGRAQIGLQYSYTQRRLFSGLGGDPQAHQSMGFVSFRYYPF